MAIRNIDLPRHPDLGLLLIRLMIGIVGFYHGAQKLFGAFGGGGIRATAQGFQDMGFPLPTASVLAIGSIELVCGILIGIGLFMRLAVIPFAAGMLVASFYVHGHAFGAEFGGMEFPLTLAMVMIGLLFIGPGRYTLHPVEKGASR